MSRRARVAFGWTALALWLLSLALPAYRAPTEVQPGWLVLLIGWVGVLGSWLPPGSPLGWFANVLTPAFAVVLIRGRRVGRWGGGVTLFLATIGYGVHDVGLDVHEIGKPGVGQAVWFAAAAVVAAAAATEVILRSRGAAGPP